MPCGSCTAMVIDRPSSIALQSTLHRILNSFERPYIVIDALDECTEREQVLAWIMEIVLQTAGKLHLVVTSRQEREIKDVFQELNAHCVDVAKESSNHDIMAYLDHELETDRKLRKWFDNKAVRDEIKLALMKQAQGM